MDNWWEQVRLVLAVFIIVVIVLLLEKYFESQLTDEQKTMQKQEQIKNSVKFAET